MTELTSRAHSAADPDTVWQVLVDHARMSRWMSGTWRSRLLEPGSPDPHGVGALRSVLTVGGPVRERIVAFDPPERVVYEMEPDHPLARDYEGVVELTPHPDGGTDVTWRITFEVRPALARSVVAWVVRRATESFAADLAAAAERGTAVQQ